MESHTNAKFVYSFGVKSYLSIVKYAAFVLGNSSSGIVEVPVLEVATIDIGDRQRGRIDPKSIIHCDPKKESIVEAMEKVQSKEFKNSIRDMENPYERKGTSMMIVNIIKEILLNAKIDLKKKFYDLGTI